MPDDITLPTYPFSRDWYQYPEEQIQLILQTMRGTARITHEAHHRLTLHGRKPPAADRTLLLAVSADAIIYLWHEVDRLTREVTQLTGALARLQQGPVMDDDQPDDANDPGHFESPGGPA